MNSAAILAGGQATRFGGRDKSALLVDGRAILDRQIAALSPLTEDLMIVGGAQRSAPRVIADIVAGCGPLGGLHAALTAARGDALFLVACDMPYVTTAFVEYLLSLAGSADAVVPRSERGYHPLCAVYTRACLEPAAARLADRRLKMRELVDDVRTRVVSAEDIRRFGDPDRLLANVNTPADFAGLEALQGH
ncbi:MAG: Molybdopterin-guanine dinucleotide biosynthesis protein [Acidobacteria bacterium]|jgi:molybdopterin-guanine dinucleotide biosynthesis protein A|nr:Molybdopterin-guanine dinucleotide biosynthesis protein [Acidobacteriota bacterium]